MTTTNRKPRPIVHLLLFAILTCFIGIFNGQNKAIAQMSDTTAAASVTSTTEQDESPNLWNTLGLFIDANGGYTGRFNNYYSRSLFKSISGSAPIRYRSRTLGIMDLDVQAGIFNRTIIDISYQRALPADEFQEEALSVRENEREGLERYTFGLNLAPVAQNLIPDNNVALRIMQQLLSASFLRIRELSQTQADVREDALYITPNSQINYLRQTATNLNNLTAESSFSFKTNYKYDHVTVPVIPYWTGDGLYRDAFRVGLARYSYDRPYQSNYFNLNDQPIVYDGSVKTTALIWEISTAELEKTHNSGLFFYLRQGIGLNDEFETSNFKWSKALSPTEGDNRQINANHFHTAFDIWYKFSVLPNTSGFKFVLKPGFSVNSFITTINEMSKTQNETLNNIRKVDFFAMPWVRMEIGI